jgi:NAD(P)-dependent dehydrogenase (short-subunit alcohol dehydrogenase family)
MQFAGSVSVITGASSGIGREIALGLWRQGSTVCLLDRDDECLRTFVQTGGGEQVRARFFRVDISREEDVLNIVKKIQEEFTQIDMLVHSAGAFLYGEWDSISLEDFDLLYKTNLRAPVLLTQAFLPLLRIGRGQIVFINSSAGRAARAKVGAYSATKFGLCAFAESLREEVNPAGIRVISVYPGRTATPMQELVCRLEGIEYRPEQYLRPADVATAVINAIGLNRGAELTDLYIRPMAKPK